MLEEMILGMKVGEMPSSRVFRHQSILPRDNTATDAMYHMIEIVLVSASL